MPVKIPLAFHFDESFAGDINFGETFPRADICCILEKIEEQIDVLNTVFGANNHATNLNLCPDAYGLNNEDISDNTNISFYMPKPFAAQGQTGFGKDPNMLPITIGEFSGGRASGGAGASKWDEFLNVFVVDWIPTNYPDDTVVGRSDQIPDNFTQYQPGEGVTVLASAFGGAGNACGIFDSFDQLDFEYKGGKILAHEIGHYLGLHHLSDAEGVFCAEEMPNTYNGVNTNICDTPPQSSFFAPACVDPVNDNNCDGNVQTANIMNTNSDADREIFTRQQACVMNLVAHDLFGTFQTQSENTELEHIIDTDVTWNNTGMLINRDVIVKSGNTLTISGTEVFFGDNIRIVVEKGAKLIIDDSFLTTSCDEIFWQGIQVWGDKWFQHPSNITETGNYNRHGVVFIKDGSKISRAQNAVKTTKVDNYGTANQAPDPDNRNGIVIIDDAEFHNNICSVVLHGSLYNDKGVPVTTSSKISNSFFIIEDDYQNINNLNPPNQDPDIQVWLKEVAGLEIIDVAFLNKNANISAQHAICSQESTFKYINDDDNDAVFSIIQEYEVGIEATYGLNSQQTQTLIDDVTFNKIPRSITFSGYSNQFDNGDGNTDAADLGLYITNNSIYLPTVQDPTHDPNPNKKKWGIRVEACADYIISNNTIDGGWKNQNYPALPFPYYGIMAKETTDETQGGVYSYIQKNPIEGSPFTKLNVGIYAFEDNSSLQILCNPFNNGGCFFDIAYQLNNGTNLPVAEFQGDCEDFISERPETAPAGNSFSNSSPSPLFHNQLSNIDPTNSSIIYTHANNNAPNEYGDIILDNCTDYPEAPCNEYGNGLYVEEDDDPDPGPDPCCVTPLRSAYMDIEAEMQEAMGLLTKYNRTDESALIETAANINEVLDIINEYDVYLSDDELTTVIKKLNIPTALVIINVLEENAPLNNSVLEVLTDQINSLSTPQQVWLKRYFGNQVNNLYENTNGISLRREKEMEVYQLSIEQRLALPQTIGLGCCKTSPYPNLFELNYAVNNTSLNKVWFQQLLVKYAVENKLYRNAKLALSQINTDDNEELTDYVTLQHFYLNMKMQGKSLEQLSESEIGLLESLADNSTACGITARNAILAINDSLPTYETPDIPAEQGFKKATKPVNPLVNLEIPQKDALIYPIPAKDVLFINTNLLHNVVGEIEVNLYNLNGTLVDSFYGNAKALNSIDISNVIQGTYYVEVKNGFDKFIEHTKVLIIK